MSFRSHDLTTCLVKPIDSFIEVIVFIFIIAMTSYTTLRLLNLITTFLWTNWSSYWRRSTVIDGALSCTVTEARGQRWSNRVNVRCAKLRWTVLSHNIHNRVSFMIITLDSCYLTFLHACDPNLTSWHDIRYNMHVSVRENDWLTRYNATRRKITKDLDNYETFRKPWYQRFNLLNF